MEGSSNNRSLTLKPIVEAAKEAVLYMDGRRKGLIKSLKTRWLKLNRDCMGGIEWNVIWVIAGMSGSGKSSIANELETSLFDLNPDEKFAVLSFNFEMLSFRQVGRKISYKMEKPVNELYSGDQNKLSDEDYDKVLQHAKTISQYDITYVDTPGYVEEVRNTCLQFAALPKNLDKGIVIFLDHTLLTKGRQGDKEREVLSDLMYMFMQLKKTIKCTIIIISQLNRDIEHIERLNDESGVGHYPTRKDIFGGDSVYQCADYVMVTHRPEMLNIDYYGPKKIPSTGKIFWHLLKNRDGDPGVYIMLNNLKYNRVDEEPQSQPGALNFKTGG